MSTAQHKPSPPASMPAAQVPLVSRAAERILGVAERTDPRCSDLLADEPVRIALAKLLFFTTPDQYRTLAPALHAALRDRFCRPDRSATAYDFLRFAVDWADSFNSPVELDHNLTRRELHADRVLRNDEIEAERGALRALVRDLAVHSPDLARRILDARRNEALSVNSGKGQNLFKAWAARWQETTGRDPFASLDNYLDHRAALFARGNYYVDLYFARRQGRTITQFFNDYCEQADDTRKVGSLGGTTNPGIATTSEDDLPEKWAEARRKIAQRQLAKGDCPQGTVPLSDDWAATAFTELVVFNAQIGQRPVFLLEGLGRISFQLRPDRTDDEDYLLRETPRIYTRLCERLKVVDEILLEGAADLYAELARSRLGQSNNHFKVSATGPVALRVLRALNAGDHALGVRLFTNCTASHDLSQITAALDATLAGIADWEAKTGERAIEETTEGGSVVTSMMGRYIDAVRNRRIQALFHALGTDHPVVREIAPKVSGKNPLNKPPLSDRRLIDALAEYGVDYRPETEEDAIRWIANLTTKMALCYAVRKYGPQRGNRILSASKRFFEMNLDLENAVRYSTDFGDIQAGSLSATYRENPEPLADFDLETGRPKPHSALPLPPSWGSAGVGGPAAPSPLVGEGRGGEAGGPAADLHRRPTLPNGGAGGSVWARRVAELKRIFPDAERYLTPGAIPPEEWIEQPYNQGTMSDFNSKWVLNVARARIARDLLAGRHRGEAGLAHVADAAFGHLKTASDHAIRWARAILGDQFSALGWKAAEDGA